MSTKRENIEALIRHEIRANGKVTPLAMRLYVENRISHKKFLKIQKDFKNYKIQRRKKGSS